MKNKRISSVLIFASLFCGHLCVKFIDNQRVKEIEEVINDYTFYPPLDNKTNGRTPIVFGLIVSFGGSFNSSGAVPGVRVALDQINNITDLLPGYSLHYALSDSQCHRPHAIRALFKQIPKAEPKKIALIGGGCSLATEPTAEISPHFNVMQLSCQTASPVLSDRTRFPKYYQFLPSMRDIAPAYVGVIKEFGWRHVVMIVQNENLFTKKIDRLKELLAEENITYTIDRFSSQDGLSTLDTKPFSDPDKRIYIIATYSPYARQLLCEAHHRNIHYPTHLLLTYQWYHPEWWLVEDQNYTCTGEERGTVLSRTLAFNFFFSNPLLTEKTDMGITGQEFYSREREQLNRHPFYFQQLPFAQYCHDATWALAWSLNSTLNGFSIPSLTSQPISNNKSLNQRLAEEYGLQNASNFRLDNFNYNSDMLTNIMLEQIKMKSFTGVTGNVTFNEYGIRTAHRLAVYQYRNIEVKGRTTVDWFEIGNFIKMGESNYALQYLANESQEKLWPGSVIPYDGMPIRVIDITATPVTVVIDLLAVSGIVFAVACAIFNFVFRKKRIVLMSRPVLNYFIISGSILLCITITLYVPTTNPSVFLGLSKALLWTLSFGYSLCYGTIIVKMFRVYYIVNNPLPNKNLRDWVLALGVLAFIIIDIIILTVYIALEEGLHLGKVVLVQNKENPHTIAGVTKVPTDHFILSHDSKAYYVAAGVLYGYKGVLQLLALLLAFRTRKIKVKGLDDAKSIIGAVYVSTVGLVVLAISTYFLKDYYVNIYVMVRGICVVVLTSIIVAILFIPLMIGLYRDPTGERVFEKYGKTSSKSQIPVTVAAVAGAVDHESVDTLKRRVKELEGILSTHGIGVGSHPSSSQDMLQVPSINTHDLRPPSSDSITPPFQP